jgi:signal transduction histidine kinase
MRPSSKNTVNVLLVEDNPGDARLFEHHLDTAGRGTFPPVAVTHVEALDPGLDEREREQYNLTLLDLGLPESSGLETLERYLDAVEDRDTLDRIPVVVLTGLKDEELSLAAIERGAQDYLVKDEIDGQVLNRTIRHALERHEKQQELRRQNERLAKFASMVSHDLRNPLNVAQMYVEAAEGPEGDVNLEAIGDALDRMEVIIEDVLTISRQGQTVEETEQANLSVLSSNAWNQVQTGDAELVFEDYTSVDVDPTRCQQLLENLFRNAIEHAGENVTVRLGTLPDGFFVEDDGPGIPEDIRDDVFEAGFTTNDDGTGFGLNIVREIARAHGWTVELADGTNGGARFEFTGVVNETLTMNPGQSHQ